MIEGAEKVVEKLSHYSFVTNILPGTVLCIILKYFIGYDLFVTEEWYLLGIIFYFAGIVCNRFGSVCIEPLLRVIGLAKHAEYTDYIKAEQKDPKLITINTENNVFRAYISVCLLSIAALIFKAISNHWLALDKYKFIIALVLILILFVLSYRKQTSYVVKRVAFLSENKDCK